MGFLVCPISPWVLTVAIIALVSGAGQTLLLKWQNRFEYESCTYDEHLITLQRCGSTHYSQAFLQTWFMFFGEVFALSISVARWATHKWKRSRAAAVRTTRAEVENLAVVDDVPGDGVAGNASPAQVVFSINPFVVEGEDVGKVAIATPVHQLSPLRSHDSLVPDPGPTHPPRGRRELQRKCSLWWWTTPAPLDLMECALGNLAITMTYASTVQVLHNFMVVASAVFSMIVLKRALLIHEWLGCIIITIALIITSIPTFIKPDLETNYDADWHWVGICFAILSTSLHALQNIWEERLFMKGRVSAVLAVGVEGVSGLALTTICLSAVQFFNIENVHEGIVQLGQSRFLQGTMFGYSATSLINNAAGVLLTKWTSGLLRCVFMALRPPFVWFFELGIGWNTFDWFTPLSMLFLTLGLWTYLLAYPFTLYPRLCNMLRTPLFCGLNLEPPDTEGDYDVDSESLAGEIELGKRTHFTPSTSGTHRFRSHMRSNSGSSRPDHPAANSAFLTEEDPDYSDDELMRVGATPAVFRQPGDLAIAADEVDVDKNDKTATEGYHPYV